MSLFKTIGLTCPSCEAVSDFQAAGSVNADRRPDLRAAILDNSFQSEPCPACGAAMRLEPLLNYLDMKLGLWIASYPAGRVADFRTLEPEVQDLFDLSYGTQASEAAQEVGADLRPRLTFGWPALREKLVIAEAGLSDLSVELLKLDVLRRAPSAPLSPGVDLRLMAVTDDGLDLSWIESDTEQSLQDLQASRSLLDDIEADAEGWAPLRARLSEGPFVDIQRLYMGTRDQAA